MTPAEINVYQAGGNGYAKFAAKYGTNAANVIAAAAATGDRSKLTAAITNVEYGPPMDTSTTSIFVGQVTNDPLAAPADAAGNLISKSLKDIGDAAKKVFTAGAGNLGIWLLVIVLLLAAFFYFGGAGVVRRKIAKL